MTPRTRAAVTRRRLGAAATAFTLTAALVATMSLTSSPSPAVASVGRTSADLSSTGAPSASSTGDRAKLRAAFKSARALDGAERVAALKKVRADAASGTYGTKVEKRADRRADRQAAVLALLPQDLQSDLQDIKAADQPDRKAMRADVRAKALAGGYGEQVQAAAEKLKKYWKG